MENNSDSDPRMELLRRSDKSQELRLKKCFEEIKQLNIKKELILKKLKRIKLII